MKSISNLLLVPLVTLLLCIGCQPDTEQAYHNEAESLTGMLQHNVYFYLHDEVTAEEIEQFEEGLKKLLEIETIYKSELGVPAATEVREVTDHDFAYSIFTWFETLDDYDVYADHPDHIVFIDEFNHLWADVKVYDSEIIFE